MDSEPFLVYFGHVVDNIGEDRMYLSGKYLSLMHSFSVTSANRL